MKSLLHNSQPADVGRHSQSNVHLWFCYILHTAQLHNRLDSHVSVPVARFVFGIMEAGSCMFLCVTKWLLQHNQYPWLSCRFIYKHPHGLFGSTAEDTDDLSYFFFSLRFTLRLLHSQVSKHSSTPLSLCSISFFIIIFLSVSGTSHVVHVLNLLRGWIRRSMPSFLR